MKLLIVDDETLTRNGLIASVDWEKYGINEIFEADDGVNGLKKAKEVKPDIVICDMRMPRMDGVEMTENIEKLFPNVSCIFMSGYSDKKYLKAAIALKVINYIEKPIQKEELEEAIHQAVEEQNKIRVRENADASEKHQIASSFAYELTLPYAANKDDVDICANSYIKKYGESNFEYFTSAVLQIKNPPIVSDGLNAAAIKLREYIHSLKLGMIFTEKRVAYIIFHIFGLRKPSEKTVKEITNKMQELFADFGEMYISVGNTVEGIQNAYESYANAVSELQKSFFLPAGTISVAKGNQVWAGQSSEKADAVSEKFRNAIAEENEQVCIAALSELETMLSGKTTFLKNHIKNIYTVMLLDIFETRRKKHIETEGRQEEKRTAPEIAENCFSFTELHNVMTEETKSFFDDLKKVSKESSTIRMIKDYIGAHYSEPSLSVKTISEYVKLSLPYACAVFKNETGDTLNQYITNFRIKKAKQLLQDSRNKVSDISAMVGYYDGNYFGKLFKKYTDMTPSEYREQVSEK